MEKCGNLGRAAATVVSGVVSACSACAGDYEDPDRTAWTDEWDDMGEDEGDTSVNADSDDRKGMLSGT